MRKESTTRETTAGGGIPLVLSTLQAARYLAGLPVSGKTKPRTTKFLALMRAAGVEPINERGCARGNGKNEIYYRLAWWRRKDIDRVLLG